MRSFAASFAIALLCLVGTAVAQTMPNGAGSGTSTPTGTGSAPPPAAPTSSSSTQTTAPAAATSTAAPTSSTTTTAPVNTYTPTQAPAGYTSGATMPTVMPSAVTSPAGITVQFPPAVVTANDGVTAPIFAADLFTGAFAGSTTEEQPAYILQPGDVIEVKTYGPLSLDLVARINPDGTLFIPIVGPLHVGGIARSTLNSTLQQMLSTTYSNIKVYADIIQPGAIGVYVTGNVPRPGRYLGLTDDTVLYYLDRAGGIDGNRGSFRQVYIKHINGKIEAIDLYRFRIAGEVKEMKFQDGDSIVVPPRGPVVVVTGLVKNPFAFELATPVTRSGTGNPDDARDGVPDAGAQINQFAVPERTVTAVSIHSFKGREPIAAYRDIKNFPSAWLGDGDHVEYRSDTMAQTISVLIQANLASPSVYVVPKDAKLSEVLAGIPIQDTNVEPQAVHILRKSVAVQQKQALSFSLLQLQKQAYTSQAITPGQAQIQASQAQFVGQFVAAASAVQPTGTVAVYRNGKLQDVHLEEGDTIVIPDKSDVVIVAGEVIAPGALAHRAGATIRDYVNDSGGYTPEADTDKFVLQGLDGSSRVAKEDDMPKPGDVVLVVPEVADTTFELVTSITQIVFQIALSAATVLKL